MVAMPTPEASAKSSADHLINALPALICSLVINLFKINFDWNTIILLIGLVSAIVDNVPLVAAAIGMYNLEQYPTNSFLWQFLAYCAGTGGSILIIGSAAGVAAMGLERIDFMWYLKKISWLAAIGYLAGALVYIAQVNLLAT